MNIGKNKSEWLSYIKICIEPFVLTDIVYDVIIAYIFVQLDKIDESNVTNKLGKILRQYKKKLTTDNNIVISKTYYNTMLHCVVYELENGQVIYDKKGPKYYDYNNKKMIYDFLSIADPKNPIVRKYKIEKIKNEIQSR